MAKHSRNNGLDCFPEYPDSQALRQPIPLQELQETIQTRYQTLLGQISHAFGTSSHATMLHQNRGRLGGLVRELQESLDEESPQTISTFGELRRIKRKIYKIILCYIRSDPKHRDRRLNPLVGKYLENVFSKTSTDYAIKIAQTESMPIEKKPDVPEVPPPVLPARETGDPPAQQPTLREPPPASISEVTVLASLNRHTELNEKEFPRPLHGYWDLDRLVEDQESKSHQDSLPSWVLELSESEANRLAILLSESNSQRGLDVRLNQFFLHTETLYARSMSARAKLVRTIMHSLGNSQSLLNEWLKRHSGEGHIEENGLYIRKPGFLRVEEQKQLMKPNLLRIVSHHFERLNVPPKDRKLIDIGTWGGEMPRALQHQFGNMLGVEPNEERYWQLMQNQTPNLQPMNADMNTLITDPQNQNIRSDMILFSHVLYFLQQEDADAEALQWAHQHLNKNGILVIVLNDREAEIASRAHMRKFFGVREGAASPQYYEHFFENAGITTRSLRTTLHAKAQTEKGRVAMRDLMRFMLPGETRHDHGKLDQYQQLIDEAGGVLKHTLNMMVAYKNSETAPAQPHPSAIDFPLKGKRTIPKTMDQHAGLKEPVAEPVTLELEPLDEEKISRMDAQDIVRYVDELNHATGGESGKVAPLLETLNIPWQTFQFWREERDSYAFIAIALREIADNGHITSDDRRCSDEGWRFLFEKIRAEVEQEIARGDSVFGADEIEIALELKLKEYKIWTKFCAKKRSSQEPAKKEQPPEKDPSIIGFSKKEVALIPKEDRLRINTLFQRLSIRGARQRTLKEINMDDASTLCEIVRMLLTYGETIEDQFWERLGMSESFVWKAIRHHELNLLNRHEVSALQTLEKEFVALKQVKATSEDEYEERKGGMSGRTVVFRRLLRMDHSDRAEEKLEAVAKILSVHVKDLADWEWKKYPGLKNFELAPDLFPQDTHEEEKDEEDGNETNTKILPRKAHRLDDAAHGNHQPTHPKRYKNIMEAILAGEHDYEMVEHISEDFKPTDAMPGSAEKEAIVAWRAEQGFPLHHPDDRKSFDNPLEAF